MGTISVEKLKEKLIKELWKRNYKKLKWPHGKEKQYPNI